MEKYKLFCRIENDVTRKTIECREMTMQNGAYCFWTGEIGSTNRLLWSYPIMFTIIEGVSKEESI